MFPLGGFVVSRFSSIYFTVTGAGNIVLYTAKFMMAYKFATFLTATFKLR